MSDWFENINSTLGKVDSITGKISDALQNKDAQKVEDLRMQAKSNSSGVQVPSMFKNKMIVIASIALFALISIFFIFKKKRR